MAIKTYEEMNELGLDILKEIGTIGGGNAATALSSMLSTQVQMAVPSVKILDYNAALAILGDPEELVAAIFVEMAGEVSGMRVSEREDSGVIKTLEIIGSGGSFEVEGEYEIRKLLQTQNAPVTLQDGSTAPNLGMLPSAFFYLTEEKEGGVLKGYTLKGGGYGHGKGMSQNGAKHMAEAGRSCVDILRYYYG